MCDLCNNFECKFHYTEILKFEFLKFIKRIVKRGMSIIMQLYYRARKLLTSQAVTEKQYNQLRQVKINQARLLRFVNTIFSFPANIYLFKVNNRNTRKRCEICSKLTIATPEQHVSSFSIVDFGKVNISWLTSYSTIPIAM